MLCEQGTSSAETLLFNAEGAFTLETKQGFHTCSLGHPPDDSALSWLSCKQANKLVQVLAPKTILQMQRPCLKQYLHSKSVLEKQNQP